MLELSEAGRATAGIAVLAAVAVTTGGYFLTKVAQGAVPATDFQRSFYRAGHGHAGIFITLGLVCLLLAETTGQTGVVGWFSRTGVLAAAILMPAGFFFSAMGKGRTRPNGLVALLYVGALVLIAGLISLGFGLLTA